MSSCNPELINVALITGIQEENGEIQQQHTAVRFIIKVVFSFENPYFFARSPSNIAVDIHNR